MHPCPFSLPPMSRFVHFVLLDRVLEWPGHNLVKLAVFSFSYCCPFCSPSCCHRARHGHFWDSSERSSSKISTSSYHSLPKSGHSTEVEGKDIQTSRRGIIKKSAQINARDSRMYLRRQQPGFRQERVEPKGQGLVALIEGFQGKFHDSRGRHFRNGPGEVQGGRTGALERSVGDRQGSACKFVCI